MQTYDIAMAGPRNRYTILTDDGPIIVHNCGYQLGWSSFAGQLLVGFLGAPPVLYTKADAKQLGVTQRDVLAFANDARAIKRMNEIPHVCTEQELLVHCLAAKAIIDKYRAAAAPVVNFWSLLGEMIEHCLVGGQEHTYKCLTFKKEEIILANGMSLLYPDLKMSRIENPDGSTGSGYTYADGAKRVKLYPGKVCNNCIAVGTPVLTQRGWVSIEHVQGKDRVHDGTDFVSHAGLITKGVQTCVTVDGVYMTPDHEVLTLRGWRRASQNPKPYRPAIRDAESLGHRAQYWGRRVLDLPLRLWCTVCEMWLRGDKGSEARRNPELWMRHTSVDRSGQSQAWHDRQPYLDGVGEHARAVSQPRPRLLQELRGAWNKSVSAVGQFVHRLFRRHGGVVPAGIGSGAHEQQQRVHPSQHSVGNARGEQYEPTQYTSRSECPRIERGYGNRAHHDIQPHTRGVGGEGPGAQAVVRKPVYDIMNAGPQNRFVVRGLEGPMIVHNCTQGTARIVMTDGMLRTSRRFPVKGTVHDEEIVLVRDEELPEAKDWIHAQMVKEPKWMPGIPLAADVSVAKRYGDAK